MIVPTKVKGGDSSGGGSSATGADVGAAGAAGGLGGRRDTEKSGRSLVAESFEMGMAHKGLPVVGSSTDADAPTAGAARFMSTPSVPTAARATT